MKNISKLPSYRIIATCLIVLMISSFSIQTVSANTKDDDYRSDNDIFLYDPDATLTCISPTEQVSGSVSLVGNTNAERIWNFFISIGLSPEQAAGIMGNIAQESKYDPNALQKVPNPPKNQGFGIVQWTNGRKTEIEAAARKANKPVNDLGFQLDYLFQELKTRKAKGGGGNEFEVIKTKKTIEDAMVFFHDSYERSADTRAAVIKNRGGFAKDAYDAFSNLNKVSTGAAIPDATGGCSNTPGGEGGPITGDLPATTLAYAWPQYKGRGFKQLMPAYAKVVVEKQKNGFYVGGLNYPGVDCGGFTTALMIDSGFEPGFNYKGKGGATGEQEKWMKANWLTLGRGNTINTADLRPGDIAINNGHTFAFVGKINGFDSQIASASLATNSDGGRAPMAGKEQLNGGTFTWYRKK